MEVIGTFLYNYLEYVIAGAGGLGYLGYALSRKPQQSSNNLRRFVVKHKKQQDSISKQIKGMVG